MPRSSMFLSTAMPGKPTDHTAVRDDATSCIALGVSVCVCVCVCVCRYCPSSESSQMLLSFFYCDCRSNHMDFSKSVLTNSRKISSANRNPPALARAQKSQRLFIGRQVFIALLANGWADGRL